MARKSNWDELKNQDIKKSTKYRDVYETQQFKRSNITEKETMGSRNILNAALSLFIFFVVYMIFSAFQGINYYKGLDSGLLGGFATCFVLGLKPTFGKLFWSFVLSISFFCVMYVILKHNLDAQNQSKDMSDINQYQNDQHICLPQEIQEKYDWFPDVGATSDVQVSSLLSHFALSNKGIRPVMMAKRYDEDVLDESGNIIAYKGDYIYDENGDMIFEEKPFFDTKFMHDLFEASELDKKSGFRTFYNPSAIPYNPKNKDRDKLKGYDKLSDLINGDWQLPYYEPQRPAGGYVVDTQPVNTMV